MESMAALIELPQKLFWIIYEDFHQTPVPILLILAITTAITVLTCIYTAVFLLAPTPRSPFSSEKTYITTAPDGSTTSPKPLPCWHDAWLSHRKEAENIKDFSAKHTGDIEDAELEMSVVIPAYNEEERLEIMLAEAVPFLDAEYGRTPRSRGKTNVSAQNDASGMGGYEILLVDDGSRDRTVEVALAFSKKHELHDVLRICKLKENRGKGGAVTHGLRHVRGAFAVFADADGASTFSDLGKLVEGCKAVADQPHRAVAVGSRSHLVGSEAVVQRSAVRNVLMHSFHALLKILTPPATSRIRDTQCGFKVFSRAALPHIVPYMHAEGWIFDVEMLMLAESAPPGIIIGKKGQQIGTTPGIRVAEVQIGWKEVGGSKLNVIWDSVGMAWGLALLRASWMAGVYRRR